MVLKDWLVLIGLGTIVLAVASSQAFAADWQQRMTEATAKAYHELGSAQILGGGQVWAPLAVSGSRLIARSQRVLVCVELANP